MWKMIAHVSWTTIDGGQLSQTQCSNPEGDLKNVFHVLGWGGGGSVSPWGLSQHWHTYPDPFKPTNNLHPQVARSNKGISIICTFRKKGSPKSILCTLPCVDGAGKEVGSGIALGTKRGWDNICVIVWGKHLCRALAGPLRVS